MYYIITWKQFDKRKLIDKQELINVDDYEEGLLKMQAMNAEKRLTTTDYRVIDLEGVLDKAGLMIKDKLN